MMIRLLSVTPPAVSVRSRHTVVAWDSTVEDALSVLILSLEKSYQNVQFLYAVPVP